MLRHPTYSKGKVAFTYLGDIWVANENGSGAERLTDNKARDLLPRFSPDGNLIAFSSSRAGSYDVYVIPATGGKPKQLTFHSADDMVVAWTPDGKKIIFQSARGEGVFPTVGTLYEVSADGGLEQPVNTDWGYWGSYSPDGAKFAFNRHPSVWNRQHYRGSYAADLWLEDVSAKKFTKLGDEDYKGNYLWPMYGRNGEIYYVADELPNEKSVKFGGADVMQEHQQHLGKISEKPGGKPVQVTHHTSGSLFLSQHFGGRQNYRVRGELRHLEAGRSQRQVDRDQASTLSPISKIPNYNWSRSTMRRSPSSFRRQAGASRFRPTERFSPSPPIAAKCSV